MHHARFIACTSVSLAALLFGCDGLHAPSAEEKGARKLADATARARMLALRIAPSPDAVSASLEEEGGTTREVSKPVLAPADAAKELRTLAAEIANAGGSDAQKRDARELAASMRRDALVLEVAELERLTAERDRLDADAQRLEMMARILSSTGDTGVEAKTSQELRRAADTYRREIEKKMSSETENARDADQLAARATERTKQASTYEAEMNAKLARAMASNASDALGHVSEAQKDLLDALENRKQAAQLESDSFVPRGNARILAAEVEDHERMLAFMMSLAEAYSKASEGQAARRQALEAMATALQTEARSLRERRESLQKDRLASLAESITAALESKGDAPIQGVQGAADAMLEARIAMLLADSDAPGSEVRQRVSAMLSTAHVAVREVDSASARSVRSSIEALAQSIGADLAAPPQPPEAAESPEGSDAGGMAAPDAPAPASDAPAPDAPAPDAPAPDAPAPDAPAPDAPPAGDPAPSDPSAPPAGEPEAPPAQPDEPAPPPAEPADPSEPNK